MQIENVDVSDKYVGEISTKIASIAERPIKIQFSRRKRKQKQKQKIDDVKNNINTNQNQNQKKNQSSHVDDDIDSSDDDEFIEQQMRQRYNVDEKEQ
jgi:hypothetical protein